MANRVYPKGYLAAAIVWLLDHLPKRIRYDVLESYWSPEEMRRAEKRAEKYKELFRSTIITCSGCNAWWEEGEAPWHEEDCLEADDALH